MGTHLRVLSESYLMSTNLIGFRWFLKIFASLCSWMKVASALEGLRVPPEIAVCIHDKFDDNFGKKIDFGKYLKES